MLVHRVNADLLARAVFQVQYTQLRSVPAAVSAHGQCDRGKEEPFGLPAEAGEIDPRTADDPAQLRIAQAPLEATVMRAARPGGGGPESHAIAGPVRRQQGDSPQCGRWDHRADGHQHQVRGPVGVPQRHGSQWGAIPMNRSQRLGAPPLLGRRLVRAGRHRGLPDLDRIGHRPGQQALRVRRAGERQHEAVAPGGGIIDR